MLRVSSDGGAGEREPLRVAAAREVLSRARLASQLGDEAAAELLPQLRRLEADFYASPCREGNRHDVVATTGRGCELV
ncbi:hypothetical protein GCM10023317_44230 [Actinopolymorpha pittospori]